MKQHNVEKFSKFYKEYYPKVVKRVLKAKGIDDRNEAEDVTQIIFYHLWIWFDDNYFEYNKGYFWKYLVNRDIYNYVVAKSKREMLLPYLKERIKEREAFNEEIGKLYKKEYEEFVFIRRHLKRNQRKYFDIAWWWGFAEAERQVGKTRNWDFEWKLKERVKKLRILFQEKEIND